MNVNTNVGPQYTLTFAYDPNGRRIQKVVSTNGLTITTLNFLYDGWNLLAALSPTLSPVNTFMWGVDISGSMQGAGNVGGLLNVSYYGASTTNCFPAYDGNGNITALINSVDGTLAANYEYGASGEPIRLTGSMAKVNPIRFSTKYGDDESDLLYYGFRYYKVSTGTWVSRDPIDEKGGENLYCFVSNDSINKIDKLGLIDVDVYIYHWRGAGVCFGGSVGHAFITDDRTLKVELSQFPEPHGTKGVNTFKTWAQTLAKEDGRLPDAEYRVHLPNDDAFASAVKDHRTRPIWDWWPTGKTETHCAFSTASALIAGGVPIRLGGVHEILPDGLDYQLMLLSGVSLNNGATVTIVYRQ
jgi:RHS repeat-associated protein